MPAHDRALVAMEQEISALVVGLVPLQAAWPKLPCAVDRARTGRRIEQILIRIGELHHDIASIQAEGLTGAAVQLRRLTARMDEADELSQAMFASVLVAVEDAIAR